MKLVAFTGRAGSGKDTAAAAFAAWLRDEHNIRAERRGFADKMKIAGMRAVFGDSLTDEECIEAANDLKKKGSGVAMNFVTFQGGKTIHVDGRTFWQFLGTEALRGTYGKDFHVDALLPYGTATNQAHREQNFACCDVALITDLRFVNEAQRVLDIGGEVWEVVRPNAVTGLADGQEGHASEQGLPREMIKLTIKNDQPTVKDFVAQLEPVFSDWFVRQGLQGLYADRAA